jgi:DNA-binding HxlR family transcriptional regulator
MANSKLERYLSVLEALFPYPLEFERIHYRVKMERWMLRKNLSFLILHGLVEEQHFGEQRIAYTITDMGLAVLRTLRGQKCFERIRDILVPA